MFRPRRGEYPALIKGEVAEKKTRRTKLGQVRAAPPPTVRCDCLPALRLRTSSQCLARRAGHERLPCSAGRGAPQGVRCVAAPPLPVAPSRPGTGLWQGGRQRRASWLLSPYVELRAQLAAPTLVRSLGGLLKLYQAEIDSLSKSSTGHGACRPGWGRAAAVLARGLGLVRRLARVASSSKGPTDAELRLWQYKRALEYLSRYGIR